MGDIGREAARRAELTEGERGEAREVTERGGIGEHDDLLTEGEVAVLGEAAGDLDEGSGTDDEHARGGSDREQRRRGAERDGPRAGSIGEEGTHVGHGRRRRAEDVAGEARGRDVGPLAEGLIVGEPGDREDRAWAEGIGVEAGGVAEEELEAIELGEVGGGASVVAPGGVGRGPEAPRGGLAGVEPREPESGGAVERVGLRLREGCGGRGCDRRRGHRCSSREAAECRRIARGTQDFRRGSGERAKQIVGERQDLLPEFEGSDPVGRDPLDVNRRG
ncbi:MAG: hypothetical protein IPF99_33820 [Deltaproteobacteria bacterium]|nr:hypothetical protein [Deltaproteobacteria bacterium]